MNRHCHVLALLGCVLVFPFVTAGQDDDDARAAHVDRAGRHLRVQLDRLQVVAALTGEQVTALEQAIPVAAESWKKERRGARGFHGVTWGFRSKTPAWVASAVAWKEALGDVLSEGQRAAWTAHVAERDVAVRRAAAEYVIATVDERLFLDARQRGAIIEALVTMKPADVLDHIDWQMRGKDPLPKGIAEKVLSDGQRQCLASIKAENQGITLNEELVDIAMKQGLESPRYEELAARFLDHCIEQRSAEIDARVRVYLRYVDSTVTLEEPQRRRLGVAAKGALQRGIAAWKTKVGPQLRRAVESNMRRPETRYSFSGARDLGKDELWQEQPVWRATFDKTLSEEQNERFEQDQAVRAKRTREAGWDLMLAMLDEELFLTRDQRQKTREALVRIASEGRNLGYTWRQWYIITMLARFVGRFSEKDRVALFTPAQSESWKFRYADFDFGEDGRSWKFRWEGGSMSSSF